jgi:hypothetical protein
MPYLNNYLSLSKEIKNPKFFNGTVEYLLPSTCRSAQKTYLLFLCRQGQIGYWVKGIPK